MNKLMNAKELAGVGDGTCEGGGGHHQRAHQHGATSRAALAALEVAITGASAKLIADELVGVHAEAHRAACPTPFKSGFTEDFGDAHFFCDGGDSLGTGNDNGFHMRSNLAAADVLGDFLEIGETTIGAATEEGDIDFESVHRCSGSDLHVLNGLDGGCTILLREVLGIRDRLIDEDSLSRGDAPGDGGEDILSPETNDIVIDGVGIGGNGLPARDGGVPLSSLGGVGAATQILESSLVGIHIADARTALDGHIADGHAFFLSEIIEGRAAVFVGIADAAIHAEVADDVQGDILGIDAGDELSINIDAANLGLADRHGLGREDIAHLASTDAKGDGSKGSVGRSVRVAAGNRHAGLGDALLRPDDVNDALIAAGQIKKGNTGFGAVLAQFLDHRIGEGIGERFLALIRRNDVIDGGEGAVGIENLQAKVTKHPKGLRARHLVNEVRADQ